MMQKQIYQWPPLSAKYFWLVGPNLEPQKDVTIHDQFLHDRRRIPELLGRRIRGWFHGWVILSSHPESDRWTLWNPVTSKTIRLPRLVLKSEDYEFIAQGCLSSSPDDPSSVLLLTRIDEPIIHFCQLERKQKRIKWMKMSLAKQLRGLTGDNDATLHCLVCCNGKLYALTHSYKTEYVMHVDIMVKDGKLVINLLRFVDIPSLTFNNGISSWEVFLKGGCRELFYILVGFDSEEKKRLGVVYLFRLDMTSMVWEEVEDLKDAILFVDLAYDCSVFYRPTIASEAGGYLHIIGKMGKVMYSYNAKDKTISVSSMPSFLPTSHLSLWECGLQGDNEIVVKSLMNDDLNINTMRNETHEDNIKSHLLNIPFDIMETIMEHCVGLEYLNFRATCKHCHLAAPMIQWSNETALKRLKTYSLVSPWLMVFDNRLGIITFTDPMFGDTYFIKTPQELIGDIRIRSSKYGWILMFELGGPTFFYNPFTNDIRKLPFVPYFEDFGFSAPPTSPDCMVVACETPNVFIHFVNRESSWRGFHMDFGNIVSHSFAFPTCYGRDIYTLDEGRLYAFRNMDEGTCFWENVVAQPPKGCGCRSSAQHYLVKCDQQLLIVCVDEFGESVEVSKLNHSTKKWETVEHLGRHMIYICDYTCICMEAKTPEMENKIYFPRLHTKNGKIVFYSLETCMFHTFDGRNIAESFSDLFGTKFHSNPHTWIEPSWF
ncbi:hypothetical protein Tco_1040931 [Tanacetum coccineum]|uniref:KIB1-4 beta-propeller domain-containing protein n=1 Tax=Tanacetum coccineum TaxID=301880 RepID=A0ABQ5GES1_9ASTR